MCAHIVTESRHRDSIATAAAMNSTWSYRSEMLKLEQNRRFFGPCDLDIWRMTSKKWGTFVRPLKLCTVFCSLFYAPSCFVIHSIAVCDFKLYSYSPDTFNSGQNRRIFCPWDLEVWRMTLKNGASLLCPFRLCDSFSCCLWLQTGVTVRTHLIQVKIVDFSARVTLRLTNNIEK